MISKEIIAKFKSIYETKYSVTITTEEATQMATDLLNLMTVLVKPDSSIESEKQKGEENEATKPYSTG